MGWRALSRLFAALLSQPSSLSDLTVRQAAKRKTAPFFCEQCLVPQPFHFGQHARTTFRRFFDDIFEFFPGAVLPKELVGLASDKLLGDQWFAVRGTGIKQRTTRWCNAQPQCAKLVRIGIACIL